MKIQCYLRNNSSYFTLTCAISLIGEQAKRAIHSQVCSIENCDICIYIYRIVNVYSFMGRAQPCMPNPKHFFIILINNEPILTSTLAAGIVSDAFA